jgi:alginate export protein
VSRRNPRFPNGYYFTLAGYMGYANLIHVKPSITLKPTSKLALSARSGSSGARRQRMPCISRAVPWCPERPDMAAVDGQYVQVRADWTIAANLIGSVETVHFQVGSIRNAGGSNADYVGVELKYGGSHVGRAAVTFLV